MSHYFYQCFDCKNEYTSEEIEGKKIYLCPHCGEAKKNMPLKGVLKIIYDYEFIKTQYSKNDFLKLPVGEFWAYPYLWSLNITANKFDNIPTSYFAKIVLNSRPIVEGEIDRRKLYFLDETRNPTLSFKDRATNLVVLKAIQLENNEIAAASTGNTGSSLAGICSKFGLNSHIFVPKNIPEGKLIQIKSYGATVYTVDGDYDMAFDLCQEISQKKGWYNRNTAYNPLTIEGKKSAAYDIFISLEGKLPEYIFVPVGDGVIISGIYKGMSELVELGWIKKLPKIIGVQSEGSNALIRYLETNKFEYRPASTIADGICSGAPRNLYMAADAIKNSSGFGIEVTDREILEAQKTIANSIGILAEPAGAASYAGYKKVIETTNINQTDDVIILLTGSGLKDIQSLKSWNLTSDVKSYDEWKSVLL